MLIRKTKRKKRFRSYNRCINTTAKAFPRARLVHKPVGTVEVLVEAGCVAT